MNLTTMRNITMGLVTSFFSLLGFAQADNGFTGGCAYGQQNCIGGRGPGFMGGMGGMGGMNIGTQTDCTRHPNPEYCEGVKKAAIECEPQKTAEARELCMQDKAPAEDCSKAPMPARCATMVSARTVCKGRTGDNYRRCIRSEMLNPTVGK
jgi:hypothetical protein